MENDYFKIFPILQTKNLLLKKVTTDSCKELIEFVAYSKFESSNEGVIQLINKIETDYITGQSINWGIFLNQELIGTCGYYRGFKNSSGEIGFIMRENFRRKGFMKEALQAITQFGFNKLDLTLITAYTKEENKGANSLLKGLGFNVSDVKESDYLVFKLRTITNKTHRIQRS